MCRGAAEKPSTDLRRPCGPSPGSATALLAHACTMRSLRCSSLHPDLGHLDRRISRRRFSAAPLAVLDRFEDRAALAAAVLERHRLGAEEGDDLGIPGAAVRAAGIRTRRVRLLWWGQISSLRGCAAFRRCARLWR